MYKITVTQEDLEQGFMLEINGTLWELDGYYLDSTSIKHRRLQADLVTPSASTMERYKDEIHKS